MKRRRVREVQQLTQSECGLCCVAMVLSAYGQRNAIASLRRRHETGRDGLGLADVAGILRQWGFETKVFKATIEGLSKLDLPVIAYWDDSHLVVVESVSQTRVMVVDPGTGRSRMSLEDFTQHYSGVAIAPVPGRDGLCEGEREPTVWRDYFRAAHGLRKPLAATFALSLVLYTFLLGIPLATQALINAYERGLEGAGLLGVLPLLLVPLGLYYALALLRVFVLSTIIKSLGRTMMSMTFGALLNRPFTYFANRSMGELAYRLSSVSQVRDLISNQMITSLLDIGGLLVIFGYIFHRSLILGGVALAVFAIMVAIAFLSYAPIRYRTHREITGTANSSTMQLEALSSIEVLKVSGMTGTFFREWHGAYEEALEQTRRRTLIQGAATSGYAAMQTFGPLAVLAVGLTLVVEGRMDLGSVVASQTLVSTLLGTVMSLSTAFTQLITVNAQVDRLGDVIRHPDEDRWQGTREVDLDGAVGVRDLSFRYPGAEVLTLDRVSLDVPAGKRVAVVGSTGSGKSTLGKLIMGLYRPSDGVIEFDGKPLEEMSQQSFYRNLAYVPQEVSLSNRSIAENIAFGTSDVGFEEIREAARAAQIHDEVSAMPLGYATQVREMGNSLSGGQRQRVAIARALLRRPRVLVLDEATSSLDAITESNIAQAFKSMECSQIIIAHRLSTVVDADSIVVMDRGRVVDVGTHEELLRDSETYRHLFRAQADPGMVGAV